MGVPRNLHISVNRGNAQNAETFLRDLRECTEAVRGAPRIDSDAVKALVGAALQSPDLEAAFGQLSAQAGLVGSELPTELALINEVLEALPDELCNSLLANFFNDLYV